MKLKITNFCEEIERFQNKNKYHIISVLLFITIITILLLKTNIFYDVKTYTDNGPTKAQNACYWDVSTTTIQFIKDKESFSSKAYKDGKRDSIGYGTEAKGRKHITREVADAEMKEHICKLADKLDLVDRKLSDNKNTAILSLAYNAGDGLARKIIEKPIIKKQDFTRISYSQGKYVKGLENRRLAEWEMWNIN